MRVAEWIRRFHGGDANAFATPLRLAVGQLGTYHGDITAARRAHSLLVNVPAPDDRWLIYRVLPVAVDDAAPRTMGSLSGGTLSTG
jgi:hypothetical protein